MNNKLSKILAGIGITLAGATMMTACDADVSNETIDKTLEKLDDYINYTTTNEQYAWQSFWKLMIDNATANVDNHNFNYVATRTSYKNNGEYSTVKKTEYSRKDSNGKMEKYIENIGISGVKFVNYKVATPKVNGNETLYDLEVKTLNSDTKTLTEDKKENLTLDKLYNETDKEGSGKLIRPMDDYGFVKLQSLMELFSDESNIKVSNSIEDDTEKFTFVLSQDVYETETLKSKDIVIYEFEFKDGVFVSLLKTTHKNPVSEENSAAGINNITIKYELYSSTSPIVLDTTGYTKADLG